MMNWLILIGLILWVVVALLLSREDWPMIRDWLRKLRKPKQDPQMLHLERQLMPMEQSRRVNPERVTLTGDPRFVDLATRGPDATVTVNADQGGVPKP